MPGNEDQAAELLDAYLERATGAVFWCGGRLSRTAEQNDDNLENRFGPLGPTRVQIPPPPLAFHI